MTKLSDTQLVILSAACQRADLSVYPLATKLSGGAAAKVLTSLINKKCIKEVDAKRDDTVWREDKKRGRLTLRATKAALEVLGIEPDTGAQVARDGKDSASARQDAKPAGSPSVAPDTATPRKVRKDTKQALLVELLRTEDGATIAEMISATNWQAHTVRGFLAGALKKKLGLNVTSEKVEGKGRVYRLAD